MKSCLTIISFLSILNTNICQPWKNYHGTLDLANERQEIELKILFLKDGIIIGSYREQDSSVQFKLVGNISNDSLQLAVRQSSDQKLRGFLLGQLTKRQKKFKGVIIDREGVEFGAFRLKQVFNKSYTDILQEHRSLYEYTSFAEALNNPRKVKSIDVARQQIEKIRDIFDRFKNLVSINLLGNSLDTFPEELTKTRRLRELSLSSNGLSVLGSEIGELTALRILIVNFNRIKEIPKEIGNLTELLYLDLGDNQISSLPDEIGRLTKLEELHIDDNRLPDHAMRRLQKLLPNCIIHFGNQGKD